MIQRNQREGSGNEDKNEIRNGDADFKCFMSDGIYFVISGQMESDPGGNPGAL